MRSFSKIIILLTTMYCGGYAFAIQSHFNSINTSFAENNIADGKKDFLVVKNSEIHGYNTWLLPLDNSQFSNKKVQETLLLETLQEIKAVTQGKDLLELENEAQQKMIDFIIIVLAILVMISSLAIYSYLKLKRKNKLLTIRSMELSKIQSRMQGKLASYLKTAKKQTSHTNIPDLPKVQNAIGEDVKEIIMAKLEKMEKEAFFLDQNCSLHLLSEQLKTNPKYLSQVINQEKKSNFNNYINGLRINYLLPKLIQEPEYRNNKLTYISASLGYNNLNTFNSAFKKRMGILPSYFIHELNHSFQLDESHM